MLHFEVCVVGGVSNGDVDAVAHVVMDMVWFVWCTRAGTREHI